MDFNALSLMVNSSSPSLFEKNINENIIANIVDRCNSCRDYNTELISIDPLIE